MTDRATGQSGDPERGEVLWRPDPSWRETTRIGKFSRWLAERGHEFADYDALWEWSVTDVDGFWRAIRSYFAIGNGPDDAPALAQRAMPGAVWFPGVAWSYAEAALRRRPHGPAVIARSQTRPPIELSHSELVDSVARCRAGLLRLGVGRGDRVVGYLPNIPEALVAFLATASLGAVWSSCPPEFGVRSVVDRLRQVQPRVLITVDGYRYGAKSISRLADVAEIVEALDSLQHVVALPYLDTTLDPGAIVRGSTGWTELTTEHAPLEFEGVPFDHPLYVLYSSGTTGLPKPIVHGHGGIICEHTKALALHHDLGPSDRFFWFSTTGWMMWNYVVSGLLVGATVVLFDGDPGFPDLENLWRLAEEEGVTFFGVSAPFIMACRQVGVSPGDDLDLATLRGVGSTGAPLPADGFRWVYNHVSKNVLLSSISGGTDVCTAFVGGCPAVPVRAGEISCRYLGADVRAIDLTGAPVVDEQGELIVSSPMPSMPVGFWGDDDGSRYRSAYFEAHPGVWTHGDWITVRRDGTCSISGRADATLNRGGVRMGTAELYAVVDDLPAVADSLVVHIEDSAGGPGRLLLFVALEGEHRLDDELRNRIRTALRTSLSPRHVPDEIIQVQTIPRTLSGKRVEIPVKRILLGALPEDVVSAGSLADPRALDAFVAMRIA